MLFAPGLRTIEDVRTVIESVDRPVNVLATPAGPPVPELAKAGAARISVGGGLTWVALGAAVEAARELLEKGTFESWGPGRAGGEAVRAAFTT